MDKAWMGDSGMNDRGLYDEVFSEANLWYPHECFSCKNWWMGGADVKCPLCGSTDIGVAGCPEWSLSVWEDDEVSE